MLANNSSFSCDIINDLYVVWISALTVAARGKSMGKNIDFSEYYELLGLDKTRSYTSSELNRAFRKKALAAHPDKGGDIETVCYIFSVFINSRIGFIVFV